MAYESGLQADAADPACKKGLAEVQRAMDDSPENPFGGNGGGMDMGLGKIFNDPGLIGKLQANPKTRDAMRDPAFMAKIQGLQRGGGAMGADMLSDPRMLTVLGVAMGVDIVSCPFELCDASSSFCP
jgi:stress-induced-phosphoprotein 1